jgi:hypothetical protein
LKTGTPTKLISVRAFLRVALSNAPYAMPNTRLLVPRLLPTSQSESKRL